MIFQIAIENYCELFSRGQGKKKPNLNHFDAFCGFLFLLFFDQIKSFFVVQQKRDLMSFIALLI